MNELACSYRFSFLCRISDLSNPHQQSLQPPPTFPLPSKNAAEIARRVAVETYYVLFSILRWPCLSSACWGNTEQM